MLNQNLNEKQKAALWIALGVFGVGLLFARAVFPEELWLTIGVAVLLLGTLVVLIIQNQKALKSRTAAYGLNSLITVFLVFGIVGVLNFLSSRYPQKLDLTKNKVHTLSDQTSKLIKGLNKPVKAIFYSNLEEREQNRALLENYKSLNPKFELEFVDILRDAARARSAGLLKRGGTLQLQNGTRETKVDNINEEKITNALIKILKDKNQTLCVLTGHGERSFTSKEADGYELVRQSLVDQSYEVKDISLTQEGKVPEACDSVVIAGPTKGFLPAEIKTLQEYFDQGGRGVIALDLNLKEAELNPELLPLLEKWHVKPVSAMIVDPEVRLMTADLSILVLKNFSKDHPVSKDFPAPCALPFARPIDILPNPPTGLNVQWLAQSSQNSLSISQLKQLAKGSVPFVPGKDRKGVMNAAVAIEGKQKDSKATKNTRLIVLGSSAFATNEFARGMGNLDFFVNSVSWTLEDENLISIRTKDEEAGKIELSARTGKSIFLFTVFLLPMITASMGLGIWFYRRRL